MKPNQLSADGHRAVMLCTTTDPYQVIRHPDRAKQKELNATRAFNVRRTQEIIRDNSTLNVRLLTRSPLAKQDFDLFKSFGNRFVLGVSLPTMCEDLCRLYEPGAPGPQQRLKLAKEASAAGISVYVAMAPTFPESDYADMLATLTAIKEVNPVTVFHEPINIKIGIAERIAARAKEIGVEFRAETFANVEAWENYALTAFSDMEKAAKEVGLFDKLHLWVDGALGTNKFLAKQDDPVAYTAWRDHWWNRISEWPGADPRPLNSVMAPENPFGKPKAALEQADLDYRTTREAIVTKGLNAGLNAAQALREIHEYKNGALWKGYFKSFRDYCAEKWKYSCSHAYRLVECGAFMKALEDANTAGAAPIAMPVNECQVRPILALPVESRVEAWIAAVGEAPVESLTGATIAEKVKDRMPAKEPRRPRAPVEAVVEEVPAPSPVEMLTALETTLSGHAKYAEISGYIESIRALVAA